MAQRLVLITPLAPPVVAAPTTVDPSKPPETTPPPAPAAAAPYFAMVTFLEGGFAPPERPVDPGWGVEPPVDPGYGIPVLPPHVGGRPPGSGGGHPSHPIYHPDKPTPPGEVPPDRPEIWPPIDPPGGGMPGYILVWVPGYGHRWIRVGARPDQGLPPKPEKPPETAQPKK